MSRQEFVQAQNIRLVCQAFDTTIALRVSCDVPSCLQDCLPCLDHPRSESVQNVQNIARDGLLYWVVHESARLGDISKLGIDGGLLSNINCREPPHSIHGYNLMPKFLVPRKSGAHGIAGKNITKPSPLRTAIKLTQAQQSHYIELSSHNARLYQYRLSNASRSKM